MWGGAELGNAYRAIDQLSAAKSTLGQARRFFDLGTGSELLDVRLLSLESSPMPTCGISLSCVRENYEGLPDLFKVGRPSPCRPYSG